MLECLPPSKLVLRNFQQLDLVLAMGCSYLLTDMEISLFSDTKQQ